VVGLSAREAIWHDVENGSYAADLGLWRELAEDAAGPILDLGAGTGRVTCDLAGRGHAVTALDSDEALLAELRERAPEVDCCVADARTFDLPGRSFALVLAPMQLVQILGGLDGRAAMLERVHAHLSPGGLLAAALADPYEALEEEDRSPPYPDMIERDGWVYSSQPVWVSEENGQVVVERHRQAVAPDGRLEEELAPFALDIVGAGQFEEEALAAGLTPAGRRTIPETPDHIGSGVVLCRR
jgi:SAM-dependent methyltransferase